MPKRKSNLGRHSRNNRRFKKHQQHAIASSISTQENSSSQASSTGSERAVQRNRDQSHNIQTQDDLLSVSSPIYSLVRTQASINDSIIETQSSLSSPVYSPEEPQGLTQLQQIARRQAVMRGDISTQENSSSQASSTGSERAVQRNRDQSHNIQTQHDLLSVSSPIYSLVRTQASINDSIIETQSSLSSPVYSPEEPQGLTQLQQIARRQAVMRGNRQSLHGAGFFYDPLIPYSQHVFIQIGSMDSECSYCQAIKWQDEAPGLCCSAGKVALPLTESPPEPLNSLLSGDTDDSRHFLSNIRKYNSSFQMTSFGADSQVHHGGFQPTFIVQGQVYHKIGSLLPPAGQENMFLQIYFVGDSGTEANVRCNNIPGVRRDIVTSLQDMLHRNNQLILQFKTSLENMPNNSFKVVIHADRAMQGQHPGRYNAPTTNEVAVIMTGNDFGKRDIVLEKQDGNLIRVADTHRFYDALQYPLMFWKGQEGYQFNIPQVNPTTGAPNANKKVSSKDFYAYNLMVRRNDSNVLLKFRQLLHQFVVDMYVKVESERLRYISLNQNQLRADSYIHLRDALATDANIDSNNLGNMVILPATFVNSPRYLSQYTQDAFTYVRNFGRPDLFVTFTCNPTWNEITSELMPGQRSTDRHDLIARVFALKVKKLLAVLTDGCLFGEPLAHMYSIEWQKRGLPHCHLLIWLANKIRPNQFDDVISAEIPDPNIDPDLHRVITKNMIHGPCGVINPSSPCMKQGRCTKQFPKQILSETMTNENGYPLYRRRAPADGGHTTKIRINSTTEVTINNSWVVPYSPVLSKMFNAHINVEICSSVKAIKYICKYINKGSDQAVFNLQRRDPAANINEVQNYQAGRYVSSNEAVWRLFGLPLHHRSPAVTHLAVHLENGERVNFNRNNFVQRVLNPPKTTLTAFFSLCLTDSFAKTLLYSEVPKYYRWLTGTKEWKRRVQGTPLIGWPGVKKSNNLGRVYTVCVTEFECFCLRLLLHNVKGPVSFKDLRTVNGFECATYREACDLLGLLESDNHWNATMQEAVVSQSPAKIRQLFSILLSSCGISNPQQLWDTYKGEMSEDIVYRLRLQNGTTPPGDLVNNEALILIEDRVMSMCGKNLGELGVQRPQRNSNVNVFLQRERDYNINDMRQIVTTTLINLLPEQKAIYDLVIEKIRVNQPSIIFVDAPGGTGKTYLLNLLLAAVRSQGDIAVAVASSGIAATLLSGGRTAHSVLKLPLDLSRNENPTCNIAKNSDRAKMLQECKLLVWDEATMSHKRAVEALDRTMRDLRNDSRLMGGMVVLLAGDFRQTLPVISKGTPADELNACLKASLLWSQVIQMKLTKNMRVHLHNDVRAGEFAEELLKIGNGDLQPDRDGKVLLRMCQPVNNNDELIEKCFPDLIQMYTNETWLCGRAILAPKNDKVNQINDIILKKIPGEEYTFNSVDSTVNQEEAVTYPIEFLNSLELSGTPSHKITLKLGVPIMLMRNLDAPRLCNGTRLRVTSIGTNVIQAKIISGSYAGEEAFIPRIPIIPTDVPFQFKRTQFPIKLAFAMTINKSQGQTMQVAGINLESPCFSHGQLYVACSRVSKMQDLFVLAEDRKTQNVVYKRALI